MSAVLAEGAYQAFTLETKEWVVLILSGAAALLAIAVGFFLVKKVLAADEGTPKMREIAAAIQEGALAYLKRQFKTIGFIVVPVAAVVFLTSTAIDKPNGDSALSFAGSGLARTVAFLLGCLASGFTGYIGMTLATRGNVRTAAAAQTVVGTPIQRWRFSHGFAASQWPFAEYSASSSIREASAWIDSSGSMINCRRESSLQISAGNARTRGQCGLG